MIDAFGRRPDLVSGRATSTSAGIELVEKLVGIPAVNMLDPGIGAKLRSFLGPRLAVAPAS